MRRTPLGRFDDGPAPPGIAFGAGYERAGVLGAGLSVWPSADAAEPTIDLAQALDSPDGLTFSVGADSYRVRRASEKVARSDEEPVPAAKAAAIVAGAARQAEGAMIHPALDRAAAQFAAASSAPQGLLLFRVRPQAPASHSELPPPPAAPPRKSPPPKEKKTSWIEIEVCDDEGKPVSGGSYRLELPNQVVKAGTVPAGGVLRVEAIDPGSCKFSLVDLGGAASTAS
jgi:hypothetical protein